MTPSIPGFISLAKGVLVTGAPVSADPSVPLQLALSQNFPNPASSATTIGFALPKAGPVQLSVFDVKGRRVKKLVSGEMPAGVHQVPWDGVSDGGARVGADVYFYRLTVGAQFLTRRLVLLR